MKIIYFDIAALILSIALFITIYLRKMTKGNSNRFLIVTVFTVMLASLFGTFAIYFDNLGAGNRMAKWIFHATVAEMHSSDTFFPNISCSNIEKFVPLHLQIESDLQKHIHLQRYI